MESKPICAVQAFLNELEAKREQLAHVQELVKQLREDGCSASIHPVRESSAWGAPPGAAATPQRPPLLVPGDVARTAVECHADQLKLELQELEDTHRRLTRALWPAGAAPTPPNPVPSEWDEEGRSDV